MKKEYSHIPDTIHEEEPYGFSWADYVTAIPSPLMVVTSYKENGKPNAAMQSWSTFVSGKAEKTYVGVLQKYAADEELRGL